MRVCSRDAAARRRRGVLARAAYAMRKARRGGTVSESSLAPPAFAASPGDTLPEPRGKRRRRRMPRCALPLSRRVYGPAEVRAAIAFFEAFTDGGSVPVRVAASSFPWQSGFKERCAHTFVRSLELFPQERCLENPAVWPVWASMVNNLATMMRKDIFPQFEQACYRATEAGDGPLLALPFSGSLGWRRRARLAGFL